MDARRDRDRRPMFIELIDLLRCPREHDDSWLVAAFTKVEQRFVIRGKLGCPVCGATYPIEEGIADFRDAEVRSPIADAIDVPNDAPVGATSADDVMRFAAMLGLTRPGALVVLEGEASVIATELSAMTEARAVALNPEEHVNESESIAVVLADSRIPLAPASVDGIVLGSKTMAHADSARVLKPGGRIVASPSTDIGAAFRMIARDDRHIVAESTGPLISLGR